MGHPIRAEVSAGGASGASGLSSGGAAYVGVPSFAGAGAGFPSGASNSPLTYCSATQDWLAEESQAEQDLLVALNQLRVSGHVSCTTGSAPVVAPALAMSDALRCSSRLKSLSMLQSGLLTTFVGDIIATRIALTGYSATRFAEVITTSEPANVDVAALLSRLISGGGTDCANLLDPSFTAVGIGFVSGDTQGYWTIDLGTP